jgi:pimeloyl-ACP methyl ester carboxylesterase
MQNLGSEPEPALGERRELAVGPVSTRILICGQGPPLLFLHPEIGQRDSEYFINRLAQCFTVHAPSFPGYDGVAAPADFNCIDDLAYFTLDVLQILDLRDTFVVGVSLGAWVAAEIAIKDHSRINRLALVAPVGVKFGPRDQRDIADLFSMTPAEFGNLAYGDADAPAQRLANLDDAGKLRFASNYEATARYAWLPYMYDPKLLGRLHRITGEALCLWGTKDRVIAEDYVRAFTQALPNASFASLAGSGHYPHIEDAAGLAEILLNFGAPDRNSHDLAADAA